MSYIDDFDAFSIAQGVKEGSFSAVEVAQACFDAIENRDQDVQAFLETDKERALEIAKDTDDRRARGEELGILAGVPIAVKDNMNLCGTHTTCASRMLENYQSPYTATCVQRLLDAGATPVGKLNMDEFAFGSSTETSYFHRTNNPWDTTCVPGGSSGGSAASVASGEVCLTLGSDTGGSIRQPASLCGVVGMKPTYGAVSRHGVVAFGSSLDQVGPLARSVRDVALCMDALVAGGKDASDSTSVSVKQNFVQTLGAGVKGAKIGFVPELMGAQGLSDEMRTTVLHAREILEAQGAEFVDIELPHLDASIAAYYVIGPCEAFSNLARFDGVRFGYQAPDCKTLAEQSAKSRGCGFGPESKRRQMLGAYLLASGNYEKYVVAAQKVRTLITQDYVRAFENVDMILMPTAPTAAFKFGEKDDPTEMYLSDMFTMSVNIAGNCAVSVPMGLGKDTHLPVSAQLVGPSFSDARMLSFAYALEQGLANTDIVARDFLHKGGELA